VPFFLRDWSSPQSSGGDPIFYPNTWRLSFILNCGFLKIVLFSFSNQKSAIQKFPLRTPSSRSKTRDRDGPPFQGDNKIGAPAAASCRTLKNTDIAGKRKSGFGKSTIGSRQSSIFNRQSKMSFPIPHPLIPDPD
jgi:hypothetical protein